MNWTDIIFLLIFLIAWYLLITKGFPKMGLGGG